MFLQDVALNQANSMLRRKLVPQQAAERFYNLGKRLVYINAFGVVLSCIHWRMIVELSAIHLGAVTM